MSIATTSMHSISHLYLKELRDEMTKSNRNEEIVQLLKQQIESEWENERREREIAAREIARAKEEREIARAKEEREIARTKEEREIARANEEREIARANEEREIAHAKEEREIAKEEREIARAKEERENKIREKIEAQLSRGKAEQNPQLIEFYMNDLNLPSDRKKRDVITRIELELQKLRLNSCPRVTTNSQWVQDLEKNGLYVYDAEFDHFINGFKVNGWIKDAVISEIEFPEHMEKESSTPQPFVTNMIEKITESLGLHQPSKDGPPRFVKKIARPWNFTVKIADRHTMVSFKTRKPDVVCYHPSCVGHSQGICFMGEVKGYHLIDSTFSREHIGQILDYCTDFLTDIHTDRRMVLGFLTNGTGFQFFKVERRQLDAGGGLFSYTASSVTTGISGWQILLGLLEAAPEVLGYHAYCTPGWMLTHPLGRGGSATAFAVISKDGSEIGVIPRVLKLFKSTTTHEAYNREVQTLRKLNEQGIANVPQLIAEVEVTCGEQIMKAFVLTPHGSIIEPCRDARDRLRAKHFRDLLKMLEKVHALGIVHRDIKPCNIIVCDDGVVLIDWGSVAEIGSVVAWEGTIHYSEHPTSTLHTPHPRDDLRALVRTFRSCLVLEEPPLNEDRVDIISGFWTACLLKPFWALMMRLADECDYDGLAAYVESIW